MNKRQVAERLLGATLVCSLGFILYSIFLDSTGDVYVDRSTQIPPQSRFFEPLEIETEAVEVAGSGTSAQRIFMPRRAADRAQALNAPVLDDQLPNAWVIQIGSFSTLERADEVRDRLVDSNYRAYHRKLSQIDEADLYKVLVGPYMRAEEAVQHQRDVDEILGVSSLLMKFEP